jgi:hypothetical protein
MRSLVIIEVEHGETTDPIEEFVRPVIETQNLPEVIERTGLKCNDWSVRVDLPECFVLEGGQPKPVNYAEGMSDTDIAQALIDCGAFPAWLDDTRTLAEFYNFVMDEAANAGEDDESEHDDCDPAMCERRGGDFD